MDGSFGITADMDHVRRLSSMMVKKMGFGAQTGKMNVSVYDDLSDNMKEMVEKYGGKVSGSVSKNTTYLINNDINSTSGKNKRAKELGIEIISEPDFIAKYLDPYL